MNLLPIEFPLLPNPNYHNQHQTVTAYNILKQAFDHAVSLLRTESGDASQLCHHSENILCSLLPIFEGLGAEGLPAQWVNTTAHIFGMLMVELEAAALGADDM